MNFMPLLERELRVALRTKRPVNSRFWIGVSGALCALLVMLPSHTGGMGEGRRLHTLFCILGLSVVLRAPRLAAGVFAEERRNQTLGLLFLSGLNAAEIFLSKVSSAVLLAFNALLAMMPLMALPFILGGVSLDLFLASVAGLPVLLCFVLAVSLLASVLTRDAGAAIILAWMLMLGICAAPPLMYVAQTHLASPGPGAVGWLWLSPIYGPSLLFDSFEARPVITGFWVSQALTLGWSFLCLVAAAIGLSRLWREGEVWDRPAGWGRRWRGFLHGGGSYRRRLAGSWLEVNPVVWLAARDRGLGRLGWSVLGAYLLGWLVCYLLWPKHWLSPAGFVLITTLLNLSVEWIVFYAAAKGTSEGRRDGTYELVLTTPLNPSDVIWGQLETLRWHFRGLTAAVFCLNALMMLAGLATRSWNGPSLLVYLFAWAFLLSWSGRIGGRSRRLFLAMWVSLICGRPAYAAWRVLGTVGWGWLWYGWLVYVLLCFTRFPTGNRLETVCILGLGLMIWLGQAKEKAQAWADRLEKRLVAEFREIVREPIPNPDDPRFKQWDVQERFPWGWGSIQQQLHERYVRGAIVGKEHRTAAQAEHESRG